MTTEPSYDQMVALTAELVSAYVANNAVPLADLAGLIGRIHQSLTSLEKSKAPAPEEPLVPAVPVKKSIHDDYIVCLEDGKRFKSLKRHLGVHYGLTPDQYRQKWSLPPDYPMVAPSYALKRSELAKQIGLGQKTVPAAVPPAVKRGRRKAENTAKA